jgi:hypothetical protein
LNFFLGILSTGFVNTIVSPPLIKVAELATSLLTVISPFFKAFFRADLVVIISNNPTP